MKQITIPQSTLYKLVKLHLNTVDDMNDAAGQMDAGMEVVAGTKIGEATERSIREIEDLAEDHGFIQDIVDQHFSEETTGQDLNEDEEDKLFAELKNALS